MERNRIYAMFAGAAMLAFGSVDNPSLDLKPKTDDSTFEKLPYLDSFLIECRGRRYGVDFLAEGGSNQRQKGVADKIVILNENQTMDIYNKDWTLVEDDVTKSSLRRNLEIYDLSVVEAGLLVNMYCMDARKVY